MMSKGHGFILDLSLTDVGDVNYKCSHPRSILPVGISVTLASFKTN